MMKQDDKRFIGIFIAIGILPIVYIALYLAPYFDKGLLRMMSELTKIFESPFKIEFCKDSFRAVLIFLVIYFGALAIYFSTRRNYRKREEHGSAKWGDKRAINKKYYQKPYSENKLLTQSVSLGLDGKHHRRNLNTLVCGGSGAGKTRFYCKPNLMQCNTSFVILDPKGEILRDTGHLLKNIAFSNPFLEIGVLFIVSSLLMTLLELLGGLFFIHVMHIKLWDYSDVPFNYKGIICLKFSILWGVGSLFYLYFINPFILNAVAAFVDHIEFSFIVGMFYGFLLIDLYKTMDIAAALRKLAKENDAKVIAYRNLKDSFIKEVKQYKRRTDIFKYPDPKTLRKLFDDLEMAGNNQRK